MGKGNGRFAFEVDGELLHTDDAILSGREIRSLAGRDPAADHRLIQVMDRFTTSVGLEDKVSLDRGEKAEFRTFESDRDFDFTVEERGWEWGSDTISEADIRRYGRIAPDRDLVLDGPEDAVIPRGGTLSLGGKGVERVMSRKPQPAKQLHVTFVVNGEPVRVKARLSDRLVDVLAIALKESENVGQPVENWQVTDEAGAMLDVAKTLGDLGIKDETTLVASLKAGAAG